MLFVILAIVGEVLCHTVWRLLDRRRIVLLSSTRGAALDVQFNKDVVTFSNHGRLPRTPRRQACVPRSRTGCAHLRSASK